jgi:hypothetical protein
MLCQNLTELSMSRVVSRITSTFDARLDHDWIAPSRGKMLFLRNVAEQTPARSKQQKQLKIQVGQMYAYR